jgi:hypothetical protein
VKNLRDVGQKQLLYFLKNCGGAGIRTPCLLRAMQPLYQVSYTPVSIFILSMRNMVINGPSLSNHGTAWFLFACQHPSAEKPP